MQHLLCILKFSLLFKLCPSSRLRASLFGAFLSGLGYAGLPLLFNILTTLLFFFLCKYTNTFVTKYQGYHLQKFFLTLKLTMNLDLVSILAIIELLEAYLIFFCSLGSVNQYSFLELVWLIRGWMGDTFLPCLFWWISLVCSRCFWTCYPVWFLTGARFWQTIASSHGPTYFPWVFGCNDFKDGLKAHESCQ